MKKPKGWMKLKSYRLGYKAAKKGKLAGSCPYKIPEDVKKLLLKRQRWLMGWEDARYQPGEMRDTKIDRKELEKIAEICPEPRKVLKHEKHMMSKKKSKKNRRSKLYE